MPNPVKSVALVGKSESGEALAIAKEISDAVLATGVSLVVEGQLAERLGRPPASLEQLRACDLCVVTGGDVKSYLPRSSTAAPAPSAAGATAR